MTKEFKKFQSGHEAITSCWRHYDLNFKLRRYPWSHQRRLVIFTARPLKTCLQTINCLFTASKTACYISNMCTCFKTSKRGISVIWRYPDRRIKLASTEFYPDYCNRNNSLSISNSIEKITLSVYHSTCTSCILKLGWYSPIEALFVTQWTGKCKATIIQLM